MQSGERACAGGGATALGWARPLAALALCLAAGGCGTIAPVLSPLAQSRDVRVAVESVDGPPHEVAQRLISDLNAEGAPLKIAVAAGEPDSAYRMRGYLATHTTGSMTAVTWAWDVYDAGLNRAVRLTGEERVATGKGADKSWAVADEALVRRIAHAGMDQLAGFMASPPAPSAPPPPLPPSRIGTDTVASRDDAPAEAGTSAFAGTWLADVARR